MVPAAQASRKNLGVEDFVDQLPAGGVSDLLRLPVGQVYQASRRRVIVRALGSRQQTIFLAQVYHAGSRLYMY